MTALIYLLYAVHTLVCVFLILVVLLQQGKGADLSVFGGGSTQTAFGARGATTLLHKLTVGSFVIFIATTLLIGLHANQERTVMQGAETESSSSAPVKPSAAKTAPAKPAPAPAAPQTPAQPEKPPAR